MLNTLLGQKQEMGQAFIKGVRTPVTAITTGPCVVVQIKTKEVDGYWAVQLGFGDKRMNSISKPQKGHLKAALNDKKAVRFLREVRLTKEPKVKVGDVINASDIFSIGDVVAVTGVSKGKGFAGGVKRWGFAGGPRTHGQSDRPRSPGSIGQGTTPGRVRKGKKMAGRMGGKKVEVTGLKVVDVNSELGVIKVSGPVPGVPKNLLLVKKVKASLVKKDSEVSSKVVSASDLSKEVDSKETAVTEVNPKGGENA
jgi:large subunit ribosomal protein L3